MYKTHKIKKSKQSSTKQTSEEVRCTTISLVNHTLSEVFAVLRDYAGGPPSRSQVKVEQITVRFAKPYPLVPQVPHGTTPQRKLLRLKNRANKRSRVERLHPKGK